MLLVATLVPIWAAIAAVTLHDWPRSLEQVVYTVDGRLLGLEIDQQPASLRRDFRVWDLTRRKKLLAIDGEPASSWLSPNGNTLFMSRGNTGSLIDLPSRHVIDIPMQGPTSVFSFSGNGEYLALCDRTGSVSVWEVNTGRRHATLNVGKNYCDLAVSSNGQRFSVSSLDGKIQIWDLADRVILHELAWPPDVRAGNVNGRGEKLFGLSLTFSPDDRLLVVTRPSVTAWDVATGMERMSFEPEKRAVFSLHSPDGSQIAVYHEGGMHSLVQLDAERQHGEWRELGYFLDWPTAFSPDGELLASTGREGNARIFNLLTSQKTIVKPVSTLFMVTSVAVGVLFAAWSVAWIMRGTDKQKPYRPFFDLLLVWTIFLSGLVMKIFGTRSIYDVYRPSLHFGMACFVCCLGFIVIWAVLGASRGPFRASGLLGLCGLAMSPLLLWENFDWFIWQIILGMLALIVGLAVLLKIWREATGCQLVFLGVANSEANSRTNLDTNLEISADKRNSRSQYTLSDMLLWTTAIAVVVGVAMHFKPAALPTQVWLYAVVEGLAFAAVLATSCWAVLGNKYFVLRIVLLAVAIGHASMLQFLFTSINLVAPGWSMAQPSIIASLVSGSLLVFRYHGYRLFGRREIEAHHHEATVLPGSLREP